MTEKINPGDGNITIVLTSEERKILKNICMEVLGNYRWKVSRGKALVLNSILDKLEEAHK